MNPTYRTDIIKKKKKRKKLTEEDAAMYSQKYRDEQDRLNNRQTDAEYDAETCPTCGNNPHD